MEGVPQPVANYLLNGMILQVVPPGSGVNHVNAFSGHEKLRSNGQLHDRQEHMRLGVKKGGYSDNLGMFQESHEGEMIGPSTQDMLCCRHVV